MTRRRRPRSSQAHSRHDRRLPAARAMVLCLVAVAAFAGIRVVGSLSSAGHVTSASPPGTGHPAPGSIAAGTSVQPPGPSTSARPSASPPPSAPSPFGPSPLRPSTAPNQPPTSVYASTRVGMFSPVVRRDPPRVYVPDEASGTVSVIDPSTFRIVARYAVGASPEHVTPDWDLRRLYVEATFSNRLSIIDPLSGRLIGHRAVPAPYNLYFSLDGRLALNVVDRRRAGEYVGTSQLYVYDRRTWRLRKALSIGWAGANHLDFTADGRFAILSTEYSGELVKIDMQRLAVVDALAVGGSPTDVRLGPAGNTVYVANQALDGVSVVDPARMQETAFIHTGRGAHGLAISRDARLLYVTNRLAGTLSVIDIATDRVVDTWRIGGSPDMIAVSPDGKRLWISNRFDGTVSVVDSRTGRVIRTIRTGGRPHGLAFFPEPGRFSLGHNGNYR